jgi:hypothetical protein
MYSGPWPRLQPESLVSRPLAAASPGRPHRDSPQQTTDSCCGRNSAAPSQRLACTRTDALRWSYQTRGQGTRHVWYLLYSYVLYLQGRRQEVLNLEAANRCQVPAFSQHPPACLISPPLWRVKRAVVICQASRSSLHLMSRLSRGSGSGSGSHCQAQRVSGRFLSSCNSIVSPFFEWELKMAKVDRSACQLPRVGAPTQPLCVSSMLHASRRRHHHHHQIMLANSYLTVAIAP